MQAADKIASMTTLDPMGMVAVLGMVLPMIVLFAATLFTISLFAKSFKEAQASSAVVVLAVSVLPLITTLNQSGESPWHLWVPALAQYTLLSRVLRGEAFGLEHAAAPLMVCVLLTALGVGFVARRLRAAAVR